MTNRGDRRDVATLTGQVGRDLRFDGVNGSVSPRVPEYVRRVGDQHGDPLHVPRLVFVDTCTLKDGVKSEVKETVIFGFCTFPLSLVGQLVGLLPVVPASLS